MKVAIFPSCISLLLEMLALEPRYYALRKQNILIKIPCLGLAAALAAEVPANSQQQLSDM